MLRESGPAGIESATCKSQSNAIPLSHHATHIRLTTGKDTLSKTSGAYFPIVQHVVYTSHFKTVGYDIKTVIITLAASSESAM